MSYWSGRRVVVTGGGGFVGSHLVERLVAAGAETRALVRYNALGSAGWLDQSVHRGDFEVIAGDIRDTDILRTLMEDAEVVFHLAALIAIPYSYIAPMSYVRTNIEGTLNVLQAARTAGVRMVVHTSTSEVYGTAQYVPIDEKHPLQGQSPYSASKIGADKIAESLHLSFDLPLVTVRPFNTFGPRQSLRAVIPAIISQALSGEEIRLGNLTPTRDFTFVGDTVEGFLKVAERQDLIGGTFNLGTGREVSIGDLVKLVLQMTGRDLPVRHDDRRIRPERSEVDRLCADSSRARSVGWSPRTSLEDGLRQTVEWMKVNLDRYTTSRATAGDRIA